MSSLQPVHSAVWRLSDRVRVVLDRPRIMGILNVTPDSFSDGGRYTGAEAAADEAARMVEQGADIIDVGGESTRPGSNAVPEEEQIRRVVPVIEHIRARDGAEGLVAITVDTTRAAVARAALDAGADGVNDVSAGTDDGAMLGLCAERGCGIVLMHRRGVAASDSYSDRYAQPPAYSDVVATVRGFLDARAREAVRVGMQADAIAIDPGLGFGKDVEQNLELIRRTREIAGLGYPVVSGLSRKSFVGRVSLGRDSTPSERLAGTLALSLAHREAGARIFRVHDVREHAEALRAACAAIGRRWGVANLDATRGE